MQRFKELHAARQPHTNSLLQKAFSLRGKCFNPLSPGPAKFLARILNSLKAITR